MGQFDIVKDFFLGISRSRISLIGGMIVTVTTPFLLAYMLADTVWHIKNPYFGAAVYLAISSPYSIYVNILRNRTCSVVYAETSF